MDPHKITDALSVELRGLAYQVKQKWDYLHHGEINDSLNPSLPTVVLVHGLCARGRSLETIADNLKQDGFNTVRVNYYLWENLYRVADRIASVVSDCYQFNNVYLFGHSLGGLVSCAASRQVSDKLDKVILSGTPFGGSEVARKLTDAVDWGVSKLNFHILNRVWDAVGESSRMIIPGTDYLADVVGNSLPEDTKYHILEGEYEWLIENDKSRLPFSQDNISYHYVKGAGHLELMRDRGYSRIIEILNVDSN